MMGTNFRHPRVPQMEEGNGKWVAKWKGLNQGERKGSLGESETPHGSPVFLSPYLTLAWGLKIFR